VGDGRSALTLALGEPFDLLIVDWMLPDLDGIQLVRRLRAAEMNVPVLMLTARSQIEDRVEGLDARADDYLPKPFSLSELLARVRALLRWPREEKKADSALLTAGDVTLDPVRHAVWRGGEHIDLSAKEFALLAILIRRPRQVFSDPGRGLTGPTAQRAARGDRPGPGPRGSSTYPPVLDACQHSVVGGGPHRGCGLGSLCVL
jgi:DNA-binding response OmpR family regulator